jgi:outer membrane lipoprotein SlyB
VNIRMDAIYEGNVSGYGQVNQGRYITGSESWEKLQQRNAQKIEEFNQKGIEAWKETVYGTVSGAIVGSLWGAAASGGPGVIPGIVVGGIQGAIGVDVVEWLKK